MYLDVWQTLEHLCRTPNTSGWSRTSARMTYSMCPPQTKWRLHCVTNNLKTLSLTHDQPSTIERKLKNACASCMDTVKLWKDAEKGWVDGWHGLSKEWKCWESKWMCDDYGGRRGQEGCTSGCVPSETGSGQWTGWCLEFDAGGSSNSSVQPTQRKISHALKMTGQLKKSL